MTLRPLPRSRLDRVAPPLLHGSALVALVPATDDAQWAAEAAWGVARAAAGASGKRREVALVDLCLETPLLHAVKHAAVAPGITEAFVHETPLNDIAQDIDGIHFLPAGTPDPDAALVRSAERWRRLHAGFRNEGALLLVCLPADHLDELGAEPEGVIALAPGGVDLGSTAGRALLAARDRGVELLGVVRERWRTSNPAVPATRAPSPRIRHGVIAFALAGAVVAALIVATNRPSAPAHPPASPTQVARETFGTAQAPAALDPTIPLPILPAADSSAWMLQLAAYGAPGRALSHVDRLVAADLPAVVSPLTPDVSGAVWYRVLAGTYRTREEAAAARRTLWRRGLVARGEGTPVFAPYSLALAKPADADRLRTVGFAGVRWGEHGPVLVGAFEHPEVASVTLTALQHAGIVARLILRTDRTQ